jgi:hypothetical protein
MQKRDLNAFLYQHPPFRQKRKIMKMRRLSYVLLLMMSFGCVSAQSRSKELDEFVREHGEQNRPKSVQFYLGYGMPQFNFSGGMDGARILTTDMEAIAIVKPASSIGNEIEFGARFHDLNWATKLDFEVALKYGWSKQSGTFHGIPTDTQYEHFFGKARTYFGSEGNIQPYCGLGIGESQLTIKDGAINSSGSVGDAFFNGFGYNAEIGLSILFAKHFGICGGWSYTGTWFMTAKGVSGTTRSINGFINEAISGPTLEVRYYF